MNTTAILHYINLYTKLDKDETSFFESILIPRPFKQGEVIVNAGDTARYMMFVNSGYLMTYYTGKDGNEHVIHFARNGWWCGDLYSLNEDPTTIYTTKALSDGELLLLPRISQEQLFEKYNKFEKYFRVMFHQSVIRNQWRLIENYSADATTRYHSFVNRFGGVEQYVPQKYIASYLGITPQFLSKIRKRPLSSAKAKLKPSTK